MDGWIDRYLIYVWINSDLERERERKKQNNIIYTNLRKDANITTCQFTCSIFFEASVYFSALYTSLCNDMQCIIIWSQWWFPSQGDSIAIIVVVIQAAKQIWLWRRGSAKRPPKKPLYRFYAPWISIVHEMMIPTSLFLPDKMLLESSSSGMCKMDHNSIIFCLTVILQVDDHTGYVQNLVIYLQSSFRIRVCSHWIPSPG